MEKSTTDFKIRKLATPGFIGWAIFYAMVEFNMTLPGWGDTLSTLGYKADIGFLQNFGRSLMPRNFFSNLFTAYIMHLMLAAFLILAIVYCAKRQKKQAIIFSSINLVLSVPVLYSSSLALCISNGAGLAGKAGIMLITNQSVRLFFFMACILLFINALQVVKNHKIIPNILRVLGVLRIAAYCVIISQLFNGEALDFFFGTFSMVTEVMMYFIFASKLSPEPEPKVNPASSEPVTYMTDLEFKLHQEKVNELIFSDSYKTVGMPKQASVTKRAVVGGLIGGLPGAVIGMASAVDKNNKIERELSGNSSSSKPASATTRAVAGTLIGGLPGAIIGATSAIDKNNREKNR